MAQCECNASSSLRSCVASVWRALVTPDEYGITIDSGRPGNRAVFTLHEDGTATVTDDACSRRERLQKRKDAGLCPYGPRERRQGASTVKELSLAADEPAAILEGPLGTFDGRQLPSGEGPIRVPLGCHILTTADTSITGLDSTPIRVSPKTFAIDFVDDNRYTIVLEVSEKNHEVLVNVKERDCSGASVQFHHPVPPAHANVMCPDARE